MDDHLKRILDNTMGNLLAIFSHGYNPNETNWENTVWGTPVAPGRLIRAVVELIRRDADMLILSTSGVCLEGTDRREGEILRDFLFDHIGEIKRFNYLFPILDDFDEEEIAEIVKYRLVLIQTDALNTQGELKAVGDFLESLGRVEEIILISSPDHLRIPVATAIWEEDHPKLAANVTFCPCVSSYSGEPASSAVILEPPAVAKIPQIKKVFGAINDPKAMETLGEVLDNLKDPVTMGRIREALF